MLYYLDTNIVIYAVEGEAGLQQRARDHIATLEAIGHRSVVSEPTWTECLVLPVRTGNGPLVLDYQRFFAGPHLITAALASGMHHRAAAVRGAYKFGLADALHHAAAVECRCDRFLTNDQNLAGFAGITVELLP